MAWAASSCNAFTIVYILYWQVAMSRVVSSYSLIQLQLASKLQ